MFLRNKGMTIADGEACRGGNGAFTENRTLLEAKGSLSKKVVSGAQLKAEKEPVMLGAFQTAEQHVQRPWGGSMLRLSARQEESQGG